jgi:nitroimidazol reductase NimA-like FMN-containing flavoprotein (pyridoxamine 5'-phosphate oxidase superfamily)
MENAATSPVQELASSQCLQLLRQTAFGRFAVVLDGRPEIFPVNHVVDRGSLVFRTDSGAKLLGASRQPVAFEVDGFDQDADAAWSVVAKGSAHEVRQLHDVLDTVALQLFPWQGGDKPRFVRIEVEQLSGRRFTRTAGRASAAAQAYTGPRRTED